MFRKIVFVSLILQQISAICVEDFQVRCDQITDYKDLDNSNWNDLIIGDLETDGTITNDDIIYLYREMYNLESLTIINRLHNKNIFLDTPSMKYLRHFRLYGNNLETVWSRDFAKFPDLVLLSLRNNNIYYIGGREWWAADIDIVDFSHNQISDIEAKALLNFRVRKLDLSHNALTALPPNGLNASIKILNLDYNQFSFIDDKTLNNLVNLQELTLSHNGLTAIWNLEDAHKHLQKIDFSYNELARIQTNFNDFKSLNYQDFSYNKLRDIDFISIIPKNDLERNISLAYNQLTQLKINDWNFTQDKPVTLTLFGNPWICRCLDEINGFFLKNHFGRSKCDLEIIGSGKVPFCVAQQYCITQGARPNPKHFENFKKVLESNQEFIKCDVSKDMKKFLRDRQPILRIGTAVSYEIVGGHEVFSEFK